MSDPTPREKRIADIAQAIGSYAREMEMDWPRSKLDDPMLTGDRYILFKTRVQDAEMMRQGQKIIEAMLANADGFAALYELAVASPSAFTALVNIARQEIERAAQPKAAAA